MKCKEPNDGSIKKIKLNYYWKKKIAYKKIIYLLTKKSFVIINYLIVCLKKIGRKVIN